MAEVTMRAEWAPASGPYEHPSTYDWLPLPPLLSWQSRQGRQSSYGAMEPAKVDIVLDGNTATELDPLAADAVTRGARLHSPIRVVAVVGDVDHVRFSGYITEGWGPRHARRSRDRRWRVTATDWMGWAAGQPMPESQLAAAILYDDPIIYLPGDLSEFEARSDTGGVAYDLGSASTTGEVPVTSRDSTAAVITERQPLLADSTPAMRFAAARPLLDLGGLPALQATRAGWSVRCAVRFTGPVSSERRIITGTNSTGATTLWEIRVFTNGSVGAVLRTTGGAIATTAITTAGAADVTDGETWIIEATWTRATRQVRVALRATRDGVFSPTVTTTASGSSTLAMGSPRVAVGDIASPPSTQIAMELGHVAVFDRAVDTHGYVGEDQGLAIWLADSITERAGRYLSITGSAVPLVAPGGWELAGWRHEQATLAASMDALGTGLGGATITDRDGTLHIVDRDGMPTTPEVALTDQPGTTGPEPPVHYSGGGRAPLRLDQVINRAVITYDSRPAAAPWRRVRAIDRESELRYGRRQWDGQSTVRVSQGPQLAAVARQIVADHAEPAYELDDVTLDPLARSGAAQQRTIDAVLGLWLLSPVRYVESDPDGTVLVDDTYRVQGIAESWTGRSWTVSYRITPAGGDDMWKLISDTTLSSSVAAVTVEGLAGYAEVEVRWALTAAGGDTSDPLLVTVGPYPGTYATTVQGRAHSGQIQQFIDQVGEMWLPYALPPSGLSGSSHGTIRLYPTRPGLNAIAADWSSAYAAGVEIPITARATAVAGSDTIETITLAAPSGRQLAAGSRITVVGRI